MIPNWLLLIVSIMEYYWLILISPRWLLILDYQLLFILIGCYWLLMIDYQMLIADYWSWIIAADFGLFIVIDYHWLLIIGYWSLIIDYHQLPCFSNLLIIDYWLLLACHGLLFGIIHLSLKSNYRTLITEYYLSPLITDCLFITDFWLFNTENSLWIIVDHYWLFIIDYWLLTVDPFSLWLLVNYQPLLIIHYKLSLTNYWINTDGTWDLLDIDCWS